MTPIGETIRPLPERPILELDELWSLVAKKDQQVWIWVALERQTRRIVGLAFGDRSAATCQRLWQSLPANYRKRAICYSDFWEPYALVLPSKRHRPSGKETGETAHVEEQTTPCGSDVRIWCAKRSRSANMIGGTRHGSACSSITTIISWSAMAGCHQFRLDHYQNEVKKRS